MIANHPQLASLVNNFSQQRPQASIADFFTHMVQQLGPTFGPLIMQLINGLLQHGVSGTGPAPVAGPKVP